MSKAFDTVDRKKLIDILRKKGIDEENVTIIKRLLSQTTKTNKAPMPKHLEDADDVDFICEKLENAQETVQIATKVQEKFNLQVN